MPDPTHPRRARFVLPIIAVLAAASVVVLTALAVLDRPVAVVHANVLVGQGGLVQAHNSPTVRRSPLDPDHLVVVERQDRPRFSAAIHVSRDGGRSWAPTRLRLPSGLDRPYAPDAAFAPDGTLYVTYVNLSGRGNVPDNLWVARSRDGGRSIEAPVRVAGELTFQPRIAIGKDGTVHLTWLQAGAVGVLSLVGPAPVVAAASTDGARSFSSPVAISDASRTQVGAATPVIDPATGYLLVLYKDFKGDARDFRNLEGPPWPEPFALVLTRSTDRGRTFTKGIEIEDGVIATSRFLVFTPEFPSLAAARGGRLYVAWADGRGGDADVFLRRSDDGGASWTAAVRVNERRTGAQWLPQVAVAPDGRVDVAFLSRHGRRGRAHLATSRDDGRSFTIRPLSSASFDTSIAPRTAAKLEPDFGSRVGLVSGEDGAVAVWADTRHGDRSSGRQDLVSARVDLPDPIGTRRSRLLLAFGLVAAAAIALAASPRVTRATRC